MTETLKQILTEKQIHQKVRRIAFEICENNFQEEDIVVVGIFDKGYHLAELIKKELLTISNTSVKLVKMDVDKENPLAKEITLDQDDSELEGKAIILVDDVLNSGRTLSHCLAFLLRNNVKKIETAVLVNRSHKSFPVSANYKGYEIATMIDEYINVELSSEAGVYLHS